MFYPYNRGGLFTALIVLYALTAGIAGYVAASYYRWLPWHACLLALATHRSAVSKVSGGPGSGFPVAQLCGCLRAGLSQLRTKPDWLPATAGRWRAASWVRNLLVTCLVYCGPFFLIFCFNNTVAWIYRVQPFPAAVTRGGMHEALLHRVCLEGCQLRLLLPG